MIDNTREVTNFIIIYCGKILSSADMKELGLSEYVNVTAPSHAQSNILSLNESISKSSKLKVIFSGNRGCIILGENINYRGVIRCDTESLVKIGKNFSSTNSVSILARPKKRVLIGDGCLFASNITIRTSDEHSILDSDNKVINPNKDVCIGDRVWLCDNVIVMKGSSIGSDTIIGASSIVTGQIDNNVLAVGSPVRIVKTNVRWSYEKPQ